MTDPDIRDAQEQIRILSRETVEKAREAQRALAAWLADSRKEEK